jgi:tetratricopeptide (TPR) repeat protein/predicted Ser/Thr protein kinase
MMKAMDRDPGSSSEPSDGVGDGTVVIGGAHPSGGSGAVRPGRTIGRYLVIDELGRGGMGVVLRAYDPRLEREVALKRLHRGAVTAEDRARFVREARSLARVAHPNVVGVFDVEEDGGSVTLAMEYVRGTSLARWLAARHSLEEVLAVFADIGRGLAAAHAEGILHRDVKPGNVIVGEDRRARILDFGLARPDTPAASHERSSDLAVSSDDADGTSLTRAGTVMGTPAYMAPEQHSSHELTAAADQFAYCVMLWEALVGERPFGGKDIEELAAAKRAGPPTWPRTALVRVPARVSEAIVRGLEPDPARRFASMSELLAAIRIDPDRRRRRIVWGGFTLMIAAATWGVARGDDPADARCSGADEQLAGVWDGERRSDVRAAIEATSLAFAGAAWDEASTRLDAYARDWAAMHRDACEATAIRREQSEHTMDLRMACLARARDSVVAATELLAHADAEVVGKVGPVLDGLPDLGRCADIALLGAEVEPPPPEAADAVKVVREQIAEAQVQRLAGKYQRATEIMLAARAAAEASAYEPVLAEAVLELGLDQDAAGDWLAAEATLREALERTLAQRQREKATQAATALVRVLGDRLDRYVEAHAFATTARGLVGPESGSPRAAAALRSATSTVLVSQGEYGEAETLLRGALDLLREGPSPNASEILEVQRELSAALRLARRYDEARALAEEILAATTETLGPEHPDVADVIAMLARIDQIEGHDAEAEAQYRRALEIRERALGLDHPVRGESLLQLASVLKPDRYDEAEAHLREAVALFSRKLGPVHARIGTSQVNLAQTLVAMGKTEEGLRTLEEGTQMLAAAVGPDHMINAIPSQILAHMLRKMGRLDEAIEAQRKAYRILDEHEHPVAIDSASLLADMLHARGDLAEALPLAERGWEGRKAESAHASSMHAFTLAKVLWDLGTDRERALELARHADSATPRTPGTPLSEHAQEIADWLAARTSTGGSERPPPSAPP